jgi:deoxyinosine 3'endonuclease (endonuclease V)
MPVLFVGHGSPMNAIEDDVWMGRRAPSRRSRPHARPRPPSSSSRGHFRHLSGSTTDAEPCPVAIVDAHYQGGGAVVACVVARRWTDALPSDERVVTVAAVLPYRPGAFFERELPCILRVLSLVRGKFKAVVVDGYVDLDERGTPGLGAHLHAQLAGAVPVVGVAKTAYQGSGSQFGCCAARASALCS